MNRHAYLTVGIMFLVLAAPLSSATGIPAKVDWRADNKGLLSKDFMLPAPSGTQEDCPCSDPSLCDPIDVAYEVETFGFGATNFQDGQGFNWDAITTVAWGSGIDLVCEAHFHGVRVIASVSPPLTSDQDLISQFVSDTLASVQENFYDGVTFDWESPVDGYDDPMNSYYLDVVTQTTKALKELNPSYQVSVCAAWSPNGIDGRYYDYKGKEERACSAFEI